MLLYKAPASSTLSPQALDNEPVLPEGCLSARRIPANIGFPVGRRLQLLWALAPDSSARGLLVISLLLFTQALYLGLPAPAWETLWFHSIREEINSQKWERWVSCSLQQLPFNIGFFHWALRIIIHFSKLKTYMSEMVWGQRKIDPQLRSFALGRSMKPPTLKYMLTLWDQIGWDRTVREASLFLHHKLWEDLGKVLRNSGPSGDLTGNIFYRTGELNLLETPPLPLSCIC